MPQTGSRFDVTGLWFDEARWGNGLTQWCVTYTVGGGSETLMEFGAIPQDTNWHSYLANDTVPTAVDGQLQIRLKAWNNVAAGWKVDNVELRGNFVPEPSTIVLLGIGALSVLCWRRRHA